MIEVETKFKIENPRDVRKKISFAKYIGKQIKKDDYYAFESLKVYPKKSLRIRKVGKVYVVNFKKRLDYENGVHAKREIEFPLKNVKGFVALIKDFGFKKWLTKVKETHLYEINKHFHIELNFVHGLGWFAEIEYLSDKKGIEKARREVLRVSKIFGFSEKEAVKEGYTRLLWDKKR